MVSRRASAVFFSAFCGSLFGMVSSSVPENTLPGPSGDVSSPMTIPGAVAIVKRFQKKPLPTITQESPGQGSAEDPLHCALENFASGTDNPMAAATSDILHSPELLEPSSEWPSPLPGPASTEPTDMDSAGVVQETVPISDAFC